MLLIARFVVAGLVSFALVGVWRSPVPVKAEIPAAKADFTPLATESPRDAEASDGDPSATLVAATSSSSAAIEELARRDPMAVARMARDKYDATIRDYRCLFVKQERIDGDLHDEEQIEVRFRRAPHSVYMIWKKNADQAKRALFIDSPEYVNEKGEKVARIEPAGVIARAFVSEVTRPIHGADAKKASRRTMDEFGFRALLSLLETYNTQAEKEGVLDYRYTGTGMIDDRPTLVFERRLPFTNEDGRYPDAKFVLHLDREWLIPVAAYSYADKEGKKLLGSYVYKDIELNPGLTDADFHF